MNRTDLDAFVAHHELPLPAVELAFELTGARPTNGEVCHFATRLLQLAGVLSLAAGAVFFVAANWGELEVFGRFALVQSALVISAAVAFSRPPPQTIGRYALLMAFVMTGVLLALFGQTYQTGADVYELFLMWTLLGLPFAFAGQWSGTWAAWLLVLNVALALFCGWRPETGVFWLLFAGWDLHLSVMLLGPMIVNLGLWSLSELIQSTRWSFLAPRWLGRLTLGCALGFATWAGIVAVFQREFGSVDRDGGTLALFILLFLLLGLAVHTVRKRRDVFPLALIAGNLIVLTTCALGKHLDFDEIGIFFVLALWLIASSTVSGRMLMGVVRAWRERDAA